MVPELRGLVIRTAAVLSTKAGYIYAGDLTKETNGAPYTKTFLWADGNLRAGECNYDAHSICIASKPEMALINVAENGLYGAVTRKGNFNGDIFEDSAPPPPSRRVHGIESVCEVAGKAFAVGLGGIVYRMDQMRAWVRMDDGLPSDLNLAAISGFSDNELYAVGEKGQIWSFDGAGWTHQDLPTNRNLLCVKCGADGLVYIGGMDGLTIRGNSNQWEVFCDGQIEDDVWDLEWFDDTVFASTMKHVYRYRDDNFKAEDFGEKGKVTCYQLSTAEGVLWSNGERDVMSYDGQTWSRVV